MRAVSDVDGAVYNEAGLDVEALCDHVDAGGGVGDFPGGEPIDGGELLLLDVDLLVPAALEGVITGDNAHAIRARIVVEGANGPTTKAGDAILTDRGVLVVPDILANAGGVIVSYFEWVQANMAYQWTEHEVNGRLKEKMTKAWRDVVAYFAQALTHLSRRCNRASGGACHRGPPAARAVSVGRGLARASCDPSSWAPPR